MGSPVPGSTSQCAVRAPSISSLSNEPLTSGLQAQALRKTWSSNVKNYPSFHEAAGQWKIRFCATQPDFCGCHGTSTTYCSGAAQVGARLLAGDFRWFATG